MDKLLSLHRMIILGWCSEHPPYTPDNTEVTVYTTEMNSLLRRAGKHCREKGDIRLGIRDIDCNALDEFSIDTAFMYAKKGVLLTDLTASLAGVAVPKRYKVHEINGSKDYYEAQKEVLKRRGNE